MSKVEDLRRSAVDGLCPHHVGHCEECIACVKIQRDGYKRERNEALNVYNACSLEEMKAAAKRREVLDQQHEDVVRENVRLRKERGELVTALREIGPILREPPVVVNRLTKVFAIIDAALADISCECLEEIVNRSDWDGSCPKCGSASVWYHEGPRRVVFGVRDGEVFANIHAETRPYLDCSECKIQWPVPKALSVRVAGVEEWAPKDG